MREQLLDLKDKLKFKIRPAGFRSTFRTRQRERTHRFDEIAQQAIKNQYGARDKNLLSRATVKPAYFLHPTGLFDRTQYEKKPTSKDGQPIFQVRVTEKGSHVSVKFDVVTGKKPEKFTLQIAGLKKYLPDFDTLSVEGTVAAPRDVFHVWGVIEDALIQRSRFFTLIDIYGHYANRGDTVKISGKWNLKRSPIVDAINWFASSDNCGELQDLDKLQLALGVTKRELKKTIEELREIRFDARTGDTHPIIGNSRVLCTYPFPLLSPRALVESRAQFISSDRNVLAESLFGKFKQDCLAFSP